MYFSTTTLATVIGLITAVALTVFVYIFIMPEKKRAKLGKLGQFLHDIFNFKFMIVEKVLQFLYVLSTFACICVGLCMVFGITITSWGTEWYGLQGLLFAVGGAIVVRLVYEFIMMGLILLKNVIQINKKLKGNVEDDGYKAPNIKELLDKDNFNFFGKNNCEENGE